LQRRLIIELDGGQHAQEANYDAARDAWLREQGFTILRFWNNDVLKNIDGVMEMIVTS
jgi:very-short-patch-repair endonuclease